LALEGQKGGINKNYDMQVDNQNMNSTKSKNNYSNTMLGRGLGRSTIVGTGLGEMDLTNNRLVNTINSYRTNDLGAVDSQKALAQTNTNNQLAQMSGDLQMQIMSLAQNLYDNYQGNMFKQESFNSGNQFDVAKYNNGNQQWQQEFDYGKTQDSQKQNNWQQEFNLDKAYKDYLMKQPYGGSGGSSGSGKDYKSPNGFGAGEDAKGYDEFLSTAQYIMSSDRDADSKLNDLKSMYETARAERSPEGDALARTISGMISSIQNQTAGLNTYKQQMQSQMNSQPAQTTTNTSSGFSDLVKNLAKKLSPFGKY
jgi:hypothetical protein